MMFLIYYMMLLIYDIMFLIYNIIYNDIIVPLLKLSNPNMNESYSEEQQVCIMQNIFIINMSYIVLSIYIASNNIIYKLYI